MSSTEFPTESAKERGSMDLRDYLRIFRLKWRLVGVVTVLGLCLGIAPAVLMSPTYEANTQLYVSVRSDAGGTGDLVQGNSFAREVVSSYVDVVETGVVLAPVIEELDMDVSVSELRKRVEASTPEGSVLINISVSDKAPEQAARIADAVGASLTEVVQGRLEPERTNGLSPVSLITTQEALAEEDPVSPRPELLVPLGLLLGLVCGIGSAVLTVVLDTRVRSVQDVKRYMENPVIGRVPHDPTVGKDPLVVHSYPHSPTAEAFRVLRTNLDFLAVGSTKRVFVISSTGVSEGKSVTAANLSLTLAAAGLRVVLVDCDLRRPRVAEYLGLEGGAGLSDVLVGRAEPDDVLQTWGRDGLRILAAGRIPPNPSELLGSETMDALIGTLSESFDYVILDAPPTLAVTDATVVGKKSSGILMVAAAGRTKKHGLDEAIRSHEAVSVPVSGIIVTMLPAHGDDMYSFTGDAYGHAPTVEGKDHVPVDSAPVDGTNADLAPGSGGDAGAIREVQLGASQDRETVSKRRSSVSIEVVRADRSAERDDIVVERQELPLAEAGRAESTSRSGAAN